MSLSDLSRESDAALRTILLTCDGRGQTAKEAALTELLFRAASAQARFDDALRDELTYGLTPAADPDEGYSRLGEARVKDTAP